MENKLAQVNIEKSSKKARSVEVSNYPGNFRSQFWISAPDHRTVDRHAAFRPGVRWNFEKNAKKVRGGKPSISGEKTIPAPSLPPSPPPPANPPHCQFIFIAANTAAVVPEAFQTIIRVYSPGTADSDKKLTEAHSKDGEANNNTLKTASSELFIVQVYLWSDTTLREMLETVLAKSTSARDVLLPGYPKRQRETVVDKRNGLSMGVREGLMVPLQVVRVLSVSPGLANGKPKITPIGDMQLRRPHFTSTDCITFQDLLGPSIENFRLGDLLVFVPVLENKGAQTRTLYTPLYENYPQKQKIKNVHGGNASKTRMHHK
ncbi:unnamed protein product [Phytomonas sp. Hart1]|nr:unnamed protein product [Phytomonas sp. Hart1]|eukprot:CCW67781.1 unnamed protein product [Phytomonas sp. isolate Hart1]